MNIHQDYITVMIHPPEVGFEFIHVVECDEMGKNCIPFRGDLKNNARLRFLPFSSNGVFLFFGSDTNPFTTPLIKTVRSSSLTPYTSPNRIINPTSAIREIQDIFTPFPPPDPIICLKNDFFIMCNTFPNVQRIGRKFTGQISKTVDGQYNGQLAI